MYPMLRLFRVIRGGRAEPPLAVDDVDVVQIRCWPWDIDVFFELNNGRTLTLYDLGRFHLSARNGLLKVLRDRRWGLAVAGASVRYRNRIRVFDNIEMRTQVVARDDKWIYLAQSMWVREKACSSMLIRTCVTEKGRILPTDMVAEAMNAPDWSPATPGWAQAWIDADAERPWPPTP